MTKVCNHPWAPLTFYSNYFLMEVNGAQRWLQTFVPQNCSVSHILSNIILCVQQNKEMYTGLEQLKGD